MGKKAQLRAIVAKRLSRYTDATTHLDSETEAIGEFVRRKDIAVWAESEDLDVSGGMPIRDRPEVGKLLAPEHLDEWDVLVLYKLDRGFRNHLDFVTFYHAYCERYGKKIISVGEEGLDMSTPMGRMFAGILVQFAEWELQIMGDRRRQAMSIMRREARFPGGRYPFGYTPYQVGAHWYLAPHPVYAQEVEKMALGLVSGKTAASIAEDLNRRGIPTSLAVQRAERGKSEKQHAKSGKPQKKLLWTTTGVIHTLRSEQIRGFVMYYPRETPRTPVRVIGDDGEFVRRTALIDDDLWFQVQAKLDENARPNSGIRFGASLLLQVAFCGYCGGVLYQGCDRRRRAEYHYYRCENVQGGKGRPRCDNLGVVRQQVPRRLQSRL